MKIKNTFISIAITIASFVTTSQALALTCPEGQRAFKHSAGESCIPIKPQRIVSLRGEQFTAPLWELGAPVVGSTGINRNKNINEGKPYPRGAYDLFDVTFEDDGIEYLGNPNQPDFEKIAALKPDLILVPNWNVKWYDQLSAIAPTVSVEIWGQPFEQRYQMIADAAGKLDEFNRLQRRYYRKLERAKQIVADRIADPSKVVISFAQARTDGKIHVYKTYAALSKAINDLGFAAPKIQTEITTEKGFQPVSPEKLPNIDGDFIIGTYSLALNQTPSVIEADWENLVPNWKQHLFATKNNQYIFIDREQMRALSFRALEDTLNIVLANIAGRQFTPNPTTTK